MASHQPHPLARDRLMQVGLLAGLLLIPYVGLHLSSCTYRGARNRLFLAVLLGGLVSKHFGRHGKEVVRQGWAVSCNANLQLLVTPIAPAVAPTAPAGLCLATQVSISGDGDGSDTDGSGCDDSYGACSLQAAADSGCRKVAVAPPPSERQIVEVQRHRGVSFNAVATETCAKPQGARSRE